MALFPPGKGVGDGVGYGYKGKGVLIHCYTDAEGMPLAPSVTPANADKRQDVLPLLDSVEVKTGRPGRPPKERQGPRHRQGLRCQRAAPQGPTKRCPTTDAQTAPTWRQASPGTSYPEDRPTIPGGENVQLDAARLQEDCCPGERKPACFDGFVKLAVVYMWVRRLLKG